MITNLKQAPHETSAAGNPLIYQLQKSYSAADRGPADCLILTHDEDALASRFEPVMQKLKALHLSLPQEEWSFGESDLAGAVSWSLRQGGIHEIYICGHSHVCDSDPYSTAEGGAASESGEGHSMISRLLDSQQRLQHAKHQFAQQIAELLALPAVSQAIQKGSLRVLPLFFLAQAGAFMIYDPTSEEFHPLVPNESRM